jgi:signal transduction histidine kinase
VADDGRGFDRTQLPTVRRPRFGLRTMEERARSVGGSFTLDTATGAGTRVIVAMPAEA